VPEQQIALIHRQLIPFHQVDLDFHGRYQFLHSGSGGFTSVVPSTVTQLCNSGGSKPFNRRSSLISALAEEVA